ncbi:MAG: hypothetical protein HY908_34275, partial [Myxococcales bacterium]|nr:hypothetical protein [Myxococcales bacterium]
PSPEPAFPPPRPYPPSQSTTPQPPTPPGVALGAAWTQRVRVLGATAPLGPLAAAVTLVAVLAAFFVGRACGGAAPGAAASTAASTSASAAGPSSLVERAAQGEVAATAEIEARPEGARSAHEVVALSLGAVARKRGELADLEQKLAAQPELTRDPKVLTTLRSYALDPDVFREALRQIALLKGDVGPDLLFQFASGPKNATSALAQALLAASDVRGKAAPALALIFDLRDAASCEAKKELLGRAIESADARSLQPLAQLRIKSGCGPQKRDDCHPCLRDDARLDDAIAAATRRPAPKL